MQQRLRVSAYALLVQDQKILLCRISEQVPMAAGRWTLPGGGIDFGEHPADAVRREVYEETGLDVRPVGNPVVDSEVVRSGNEQAHALRLIYSCEVTGGQLRDEASGSTDRAQWFTLSETDPLPLVPLARLGLRLASR